MNTAMPQWDLEFVPFKAAYKVTKESLQAVTPGGPGYDDPDSVYEEGHTALQQNLTNSYSVLLLGAWILVTFGVAELVRASIESNSYRGPRLELH